MSSRWWRAAAWLATCFLFFAPAILFAQSDTLPVSHPYDSFNQSPVIQVHGLPFIGSGTVLSSGRKRYQLISDTANNFAVVSRQDESVLFDGETERLTFVYAQGWREDFEWSIQIPYINHDGGRLDHLVKTWHELFGLPQKARDSRPRNQFVYQYTRDGVTRLSLTDPVSGLGDVRLTGAWQWRRADLAWDTNLALRWQISLPTGDSDKLLGSGGTDIALWCSGDKNRSWFSYPGNLWGGAGLLVLGDGKVLEQQQRPLALFGTIGAGARVSSSISLKIQVDYHSPLYQDSHLVPINSHAVQLTLGGDVHLSRKSRLELAVKEDPTVNASPDAVFHVGLTIADE